jgi:hypothetical protein
MELGNIKKFTLCYVVTTWNCWGTEESEAHREKGGSDRSVCMKVRNEVLQFSTVIKCQTMSENDAGNIEWKA